MHAPHRMHLSEGQKPSMPRRSERPLSTSTTWIAPRARRAKVRRDLRDRRAERAAREHAHENAEVGKARISFSMPIEAMCSGGRFAEGRRCLRWCRRRSCRSRPPRSCAPFIRRRPSVIGRVCRRWLSARYGTSVLPFSFRSFSKNLGHIGAQLVHRRHHDVRRLVVELLDALAEVGLDDLDAALQERPHLAFVGEHGFALHQDRRHSFPEDRKQSGYAPRRRAPVHLHAVGDGVALELLEVVEVRERVLLDRRRRGCAALPIRESRPRGRASASGPRDACHEFRMGLGFRKTEKLRRGPRFMRALRSLRDVDELELEAEALGAALLVHHARGVRRDDVLGAGGEVGRSPCRSPCAPTPAPRSPRTSRRSRSTRRDARA